MILLKLQQIVFCFINRKPHAPVRGRLNLRLYITETFHSTAIFTSDNQYYTNNDVDDRYSL